MPRHAAFLQGEAMVIANNAEPALRLAAYEMQQALGPRVQLCDGVADEVKVLAALNALPAVATGGLRGGRLLFSAGDFYFDALLTIPAGVNQLIMEGAGFAAHINVRGATDGITWAGSAQTLTFRNLHLEGNNLAGHGLVVPAGGGHLSFQGVQVSGFLASGKSGLYALNALHRLKIDRDCFFTNNANGVYVKAVMYETQIDGRFTRNLARQLTVIKCAGEAHGFYESSQAGDGSTDALVYLLDCHGFTFAPASMDGWPTSNNNNNLLEVGKDTRTNGCEGVVLLGGKYEMIAGYTGTGVPIRCSVGASGIDIGGQVFYCRNTANSPIKLTSDADQHVHTIHIGTIIWDTEKPPFTADSNVRFVWWDGFADRSYIFALDNLAAGQTNAAVPIPGTTSPSYWQGSRGWAVQLEVRCSAAIPAGESLTIAVRSGSIVMLSAALAAGDQNKMVVQNPFAGNWGVDTINCVYTSSNNGGWAATLDVVVIARIAENQSTVAIVP